MKTTALLFTILSLQIFAFGQTEYINFYPWTSGSATGTMTSDPDIGEFGTKTGCYTATTSVVNSGGTFQTSNPQMTSALGTTLGLRIGVDRTLASQTTTITIDLRKNGVLEDLPVSFSIHDINAAACGTLASNRFIDVVSVQGFKRTNGTTVNTSVSYNPNAMSNVGTGNIQSGFTITGSPSAGGNLSSVVQFTSTTVCRIVITYSSGTGTPPTCTASAPWPLNAGDNPRAQEIAISPLTIPTPCSVALPVAFGDMFAWCEGNERLVHWYTYSELNNDFFELQLSRDGEHYETWTRVPSQGNASNRQDYKLELPQIIGEDIYCKIVQQDKDGSRETLKVIAIDGNCTSSSEECVVFPNPFSENCSLYFDPVGESLAPVNVRIVNLLGETVYNEQFKPEPSQTMYPLYLKELNAGMYLIEVTQLNRKHVVKVNKY